MRRLLSHSDARLDRYDRGSRLLSEALGSDRDVRCATVECRAICAAVTREESCGLANPWKRYKRCTTGTRRTRWTASLGGNEQPVEFADEQKSAA